MARPAWAALLPALAPRASAPFTEAPTDAIRAAMAEMHPPGPPRRAASVGDKPRGGPLAHRQIALMLARPAGAPKLTTLALLLTDALSAPDTS